MSRVCKGRVKEILIFSVYLGFMAVSLGIIGRLGKIFSVGLNFYCGGKGHLERNARPQVILNGVKRS